MRDAAAPASRRLCIPPGVLTSCLAGPLLGPARLSAVLRDWVRHPWGRPALDEDDTSAANAAASSRAAFAAASGEAPADDAAALRFLAGGTDGRVSVFRGVDGLREAGWEAHSWGHTVRALVSLGDGLCVSVSTDKLLRVWQVPAGSCVRTLQGHADSVRVVVALRDAGRIASASDDCTVRVWSVDSGACEAVLEGHTGPVWALTVLPDGRLTSGSWDTSVRVWPLAATRAPAAGAGDAGVGAARPLVLTGHTKEVNALAPLGAGRLVSAGADAALRVWRTSDGTCERSIDVGRLGVVTTMAVLSKTRVITGGSDRTLRVYEPRTGRCLKTLKGHTDGVLAVARVADQPALCVSGSSDKTVVLWNLDAPDGQERVRVIIPPPQMGAVWALCATSPPPLSDDAESRVSSATSVAASVVLAPLPMAPDSPGWARAPTRAADAAGERERAPIATQPAASAAPDANAAVQSYFSRMEAAAAERAAAGAQAQVAEP